MLLALVERPGQLISSEELRLRVWSDLVVDEANIRVQIGKVRKALARGAGTERSIETVPLKGYCFVVPVTSIPAPRNAGTDSSAHNVPPQLFSVVGRGRSVEIISEALDRHRLVTIVGSGGIGKSTVAGIAVRQIATRYEHGLRYVDFSTLTDSRLVVTALAAAVGLGVISDNPLSGLLAFLRSREMLLVLDTCEHVIDAVAKLADAVLANAPATRILATSRETLRSTGEWVHHLPPLDFPEAQAQPSLHQAVQYSAVKLLIDRVSARAGVLSLEEADAAHLVSICRQLDGIPLAIEFAAARVDELGLRGVAHRIRDSFAVLTQGRRTALPRHQTLAATLDWSYQLLAPHEKLLLQRLSAFRGAFTAGAACFLAAPVVTSDESALAGVSSLFNKSLLNVYENREEPLYRLLDTTRGFVSAKLAEEGDHGAVAALHAQFVEEVLSTAEGQWPLIDANAWVARYGHLIDDVRGAIDWALSTNQTALAVRLIARSSTFWFALSLLQEYGAYLRRAVGTGSSPILSSPSDVVRLWDCLGHVIWHTRGNIPEMAAAFQSALHAAQAQGDVRAPLRALWGIHLASNLDADYEKALSTLHRYEDLLASLSDATVDLTYHRMAALVQHYAGLHRLSKGHVEYLLRNAGGQGGKARQTGLLFDQRVTARAMLARDLFFLGFADQARDTAEQGVGLARSIGHSLSYCFVLATTAIPIAFWTGDKAMAAELTKALLEIAEEYSFVMWHSFGLSFRALIEAPDKVPDEPLVGLHLLETVATIDEMRASPVVLARAERGLGGWSLPELLRVKAIHLMRCGPGNLARAESLLTQALDKARDQEALAWELRAAASLAELWATLDRRSAAAKLLSDVRTRFTEGFDAVDYTRATTLLNTLL